MRLENQRFMEVVLRDPDALLDDAIEWIACHKYPQDVFSEAALDQWAFDNGYIKEE